MGETTLVDVAALASLLPVTVWATRRSAERDVTFWSLLTVAVAGPLVAAVHGLSQGWVTGLSVALWASMATSIAVFAAACVTARPVWRLTTLLLPYLFFVGIGALAADRLPRRPLMTNAPAAWLDVHIVASLLTYGLVTVAAVSAVAVFLHERALKGRTLQGFAEFLPSLADAERIELRLILASVLVLTGGLLTGAGTLYLSTGRPFQFDHKTVFAVLALAALLGLLAMHYRTGLRGRRAARVMLFGYLLLSLAYPGVKFVLDVLLGRGSSGA